MVPTPNFHIIDLCTLIHKKFIHMYFRWYILIGILSGFVAGKIMRGGGFGIFINLLVGIIGGLLGGWVFSLLGIATAGILGSLVTSVIGAILLLWIVSLFKTPHKTDI